jgi:hypothetical protein
MERVPGSGHRPRHRGSGAGRGGGGVREEGHTGEGGASSGRCGTRRGKGEWAGGRGVE